MDRERVREGEREREREREREKERRRAGHTMNTADGHRLADNRAPQMDHGSDSSAGSLSLPGSSSYTWARF